MKRTLGRSCAFKRTKHKEQDCGELCECECHKKIEWERKLLDLVDNKESGYVDFAELIRETISNREKEIVKEIKALYPQDMREIKFRAWDTKRNEMLGWIFLKEKQAKFLEYDWLISMQFTGLKDKKGVEVYEGDIVKIQNEHLKVEWVENGYWMRNENFDQKLTMNETLDSEIIGNIYEVV